MSKKKSETALNIQPGVHQPPDVNPVRKTGRKKQRLKTDDFVNGIREGNITILSQAITMIESDLYEHRKQASEIINGCLPYSGHSVRIGITGVPGVGKSTFIESLGNYVIGQGSRLAVLAIDPSSERSKGSILGDKTRMETLAVNSRAYIRPSPSKGSLGGVASRTREAMILCEAAGFDCIFIETVGVGQSETLVHSMTDFFLLLQLAGAGDELQGIKRGIMEMADAIVITKADGTNIRTAELAKTQYNNALMLFPLPLSGLRPAVLTSSALNHTGIPAVWDYIQHFLSTTKQNGYFSGNRLQQQKYWFLESIRDRLTNHFFNHRDVKQMLPELEKMIDENRISSVAAASQLLELFFKENL